MTDPNRLRVVQDATSTRILEGLLATMLVCAVLAGILMDTRKVVPKNPCSIAAVGSFLADSNLMDRLPEFEGAEGMATDERERQLVQNTSRRLADGTPRSRTIERRDTYLHM